MIDADKIVTHPSTLHSPYVLIDRLIKDRDKIKFIVGVIQYRDGDMEVMNSPCTSGEMAFASMLLQADIIEKITGRF